MRWITALVLMGFSLSFAQHREPTMDELMDVKLKPEWEVEIQNNTTGSRRGPLYDENDEAERRKNRRDMLENRPEVRDYAVAEWKKSQQAPIEPKIKIQAPEVREPTTKDLMVVTLPAKWEQQIWRAGQAGKGPLSGDEIDYKREMERASILNHEPAVRDYAVAEWTRMEQERLLLAERTRVERERLKKEKAEELRLEREARIPPMYLKGDSETVVTFCGRRNPEKSGEEITPFVYLKILKTKQASGAYSVSSRVTVHTDYKTFLNDPTRQKAIVDAVGRRNLFGVDQISPIAYGEDYAVDYPAFALPFLRVDIADKLTGHVAVVRNTVHPETYMKFVQLDLDIDGYAKIQTEAGKWTHEINRLRGDISVVSVDTDPKDNSKLKSTPYVDQVYRDVYLECTTKAYENIVGP